MHQPSRDLGARRLEFQRRAVRLGAVEGDRIDRRRARRHRRALLLASVQARGPGAECSAADRGVRAHREGLHRVAKSRVGRRAALGRRSAGIRDCFLWVTVSSIGLGKTGYNT